VNDYPASLTNYRDQLEGRSMLVKRCRMEPIECVARGYVSGSGWKDYRTTGAICGIKLPAGLRESDRLPEPIFTPASKAEPATTKTSPSKLPSKPWAKRPPPAARSDFAHLQPPPPPTPNPAASSSPTPNSNSAGMAIGSCSATKS
jgi:hypothetical protein